MQIREKIIFVYGWAGNRKQEKTAKQVLKDYDVSCFEYNSRLEQSLEEIAKELDGFVTSEVDKNERVSLIGVSAGGIISSYYASFVSPEKVNKVITICSPFKGAYFVNFYLSKRRGVRELSKNSPFLKKLNSKKLDKNKTLNFYSCLDILVPRSSGKGENPVHTWNCFHFLIHKDKKIFNKIKEFLES